MSQFVEGGDIKHIDLSWYGQGSVLGNETNRYYSIMARKATIVAYKLFVRRQEELVWDSFCDI